MLLREFPKCETSPVLSMSLLYFQSLPVNAKFWRYEETLFDVQEVKQ